MIQNSKIKIFKSKFMFKNFGFSLIEMLVVVFVFSILGVVVTQSLATSLRSSKKSESIDNVKENVEYAISVIERSLRTAKSIDCSNSSQSKLQYITSSGSSAYFECNSGNIASNSGTLKLFDSNKAIVTDCNIFNVICPSEGSQPDSVDIQITARAVGLEGAESASFTTKTKILLRNY